uniref:Uncharacterized protein n=1 Tax=Anguilla anguilla TaxID=7936 RepID=A0A0E9RI33_ANGAN
MEVRAQSFKLRI